MPLSLKIFKKCIKHRIDTQLVKHLHFFDLQCLIIQMDTSDVIQYLKMEKDKKMKEKGIKEVKNISGNEALKFLGR